jgi:hypothetical protein
MAALIFLLLKLVASLFKSRSRLEAENAALRQQLTVLQRKVRGRVRFTNNDRLFLILLYRWFPSVLKAIKIIRPEALVRRHRAGFCRYWLSVVRDFQRSGKMLTVATRRPVRQFQHCIPAAVGKSTRTRSSSATRAERRMAGAMMAKRERYKEPVARRVK